MKIVTVEETKKIKGGGDWKFNCPYCSFSATAGTGPMSRFSTS